MNTISPFWIQNPLHLFLFSVFVFIFYFTPSFIAFLKKLPQRRNLFLLNLFLGWTVLGWCMAFIWCFLRMDEN